MRSVAAALAACLALGACTTFPAPTPLPPQVMHVPVTRYVPIPDEYTQPCSWTRDAPPSQVFRVMGERTRCLERYEADRRTVRGIQGSPVID